MKPPVYSLKERRQLVFFLDETALPPCYNLSHSNTNANVNDAYNWHLYTSYLSMLALKKTVLRTPNPSDITNTFPPFYFSTQTQPDSVTLKMVAAHSSETSHKPFTTEYEREREAIHSNSYSSYKLPNTVTAILYPSLDLFIYCASKLTMKIHYCRQWHNANELLTSVCSYNMAARPRPLSVVQLGYSTAHNKE
jgi:hypothetical protein